jgi:xanthine/uracil permease
MTLDTKSLVIATVVGTVLQVAMVLAGHANPGVAKLFAVGGMGFSLVAGLIYGWRAHPAATMDAVTGGTIAGAVCALLGILVSFLLGDVPASLLALGTISSAVTGAVGGAIGRAVGR